MAMKYGEQKNFGNMRNNTKVIRSNACIAKNSRTTTNANSTVLYGDG